jgi:hypothetical protein
MSATGERSEPRLEGRVVARLSGARQGGAGSTVLGRRARMSATGERSERGRRQ